jgi:hypothetical protein
MPLAIAAPVATVAMAIYNYLMARWAVTRGRGSRALAQS